MFADLTPVQESLFLTLYARALDSRSAHPILGDTASADLARVVDYDFTRQRVPNSLVLEVATRTKALDELVRRFTHRHPEAVVVDLGCGLDTRAQRCDVPRGVDWYDVDFPVVAAMRERFLAAHSHPVGADLTTTEWLEVLPTDRPTLIVADGLMAFLTDDALREVIRALTAHLPTGEFASNAYSPFGMWASRFSPTFTALGITPAATGFLDPHVPESWEAGLTLVEEQLLIRSPDVAHYPQPLRSFTRLRARSTRVCRDGSRVLHYRF